MAPKHFNICKLYHCKNGWANNNSSTFNVQRIFSVPVCSKDSFHTRNSWGRCHLHDNENSLIKNWHWQGWTMTWRDLYWKVLRISYIVKSRLFFNSLFLLVWFLFTLNFTITSTIHNYDKNLENKRTCCSRSIFHHYMFKVIIKILPSVTEDRTKWSSLGFSCVSHFKYQFILHSLL